MSAQRGASETVDDRQPTGVVRPGLPWWAAVVIAAAATALGVAFDAQSGHKELTGLFTAMYVLGCVAAVCAVRRSGVFTAVIQPPLILFFAVPGAYWLFHGAEFTDLKGVAINCGYPLIERFPLMLFTSAGVLLLGLGRWYFSSAERAAAAKAGGEKAASGLQHVVPVVEKVVARLVAALNHRPARAAGSATSRRRTAGRPNRRTARPREAGSARRYAPTAARHSRPSAYYEPDLDDLPPRPRRRPASAGGEDPPPSRHRRPRPPAEGAPARSRHVRPPVDDMPAYRTAEPRVRRRPPPVHGDEPPAAPRRARPTSDTGRHDRAWDARRDQPPPRRQPGPRVGGGRTDAFDSGHHPVSRVRYRGAEPEAERPARPRRPSTDDAESWQYDI
ncbi:MAG TPA: DUF6542 domain-containing protein [Mycobacterium sp.]|nr:DUF6542 domain-containing protein [Mycobacterium sp.]